MKKVLITGASGFIGSKLVEKFVNSSFQVILWDRKESKQKDISVIGVDMSDKIQITGQLKGCYPDIVIHCAGSADVGKSVKYPELDYAANVTVTHNLLFALHENGLDNIRFVFLSSAGVYGNSMELPITEETQLHPMSPYALHKVMCEELCEYFANNYGMDIKIARIFSAYGEGLRKQIFWDMYNKVKMTGRLDMFGTGRESRDYIHVDDVIQAIFLMATKKSEGKIFNVANGEETTIQKVTDIFAKYSNVNKEGISFNGVIREGDPLNWKADISRLTRLGYKKSKQFENGIEDYIKWVENNEN